MIYLFWIREVIMNSGDFTVKAWVEASKAALQTYKSFQIWIEPQIKSPLISASD